MPFRDGGSDEVQAMLVKDAVGFHGEKEGEKRGEGEAEYNSGGKPVPEFNSGTAGGG